MARGSAPTPLRRAVQPSSTGCRRECKVAATVLFVLAVVVHATGGVLGVRLLRRRARGLAVVAGVPLRLHRSPAGDRGAVRRVRRAAAASSAGASGSRCSGSRCRWPGCGRPGTSWSRATLGVGRHRAAGRDHPGARRSCAGLERLRVPRVLVAISGFMVRYADVVTGEMRRMRVARSPAGYDGRWIWQARAVAASAGALFVRSTSGASASTWPCCRGATTARCRPAAGPPPPPGSGRGAGAPGRRRRRVSAAWLVR